LFSFQLKKPVDILPAPITLAIVMGNTNTHTTGAGNSAARIESHPHLANRFAIVDCYGDFLKNPHGAVCSFKTSEDAAKHLSHDAPLTEIEKRGHELASFIGQLIDEGHLDKLPPQDSMSGMTPKQVAMRLWGKFADTAGY
jgi:hypothetical protein